MKQVCCEDCDMPYKNFPLDTHLPNEQWEVISGRYDGGGILCIACIAKRIRERIPEATCIDLSARF